MIHLLLLCSLQYRPFGSIHLGQRSCSAGLIVASPRLVLGRFKVTRIHRISNLNDQNQSSLPASKGQAPRPDTQGTLSNRPGYHEIRLRRA